ncbi:MAG: amino acid permease [Planctomycetia bacterium]|nr:amino acid permease [Planctomycetia bacterium]
MAASSTPSAAQNPHRLAQVLGLFSVVAIVVGEVIGSGIFFKPRQIAEATQGYVGLILALWVLCGLVNLCGALTMAELAAMFPHAGGTYVFLRETYGRLWSFLWAWAEFWVIRTGAIAALAVYTAVALENILTELNFGFIVGHRKSVAVAAIALLGTINILGTRLGGGVLNVATVIKAGFVAFLAALPFIAIRSEPFNLGTLWPSTVEANLVVGIGTALAAIMWAYDGWGNVTVVAEEVHNPQRSVPRALIAGVLILIVLYTGANLAYHLTLPSSTIAAEECPAIAVCEKLLPNFGARLMQAMLLVSLFGALNANILVGPRVLFAVARDHRFLGKFARVHPTTRTPAWAIACMSAWASALILMGGLSWDPNVQLFDILTEWTVFGGSIFYFSAVVAVFILRVRRPDAERPYRTWGYPVVPAVFISFYIFLLASMYWARPIDRMIGLGLIAVGAIAYFALGERSSDAIIAEP